MRKITLKEKNEKNISYSQNKLFLNPKGYFVCKFGKQIKYLDKFGRLYHKHYSTESGVVQNVISKKEISDTVSFHGCKNPHSFIKNITENIVTNDVTINQDGAYPLIKVSELLTENFAKLETLNRDQTKSILNDQDHQNMLFQCNKIILEVKNASKFKKLSNNLSKILS